MGIGQLLPRLTLALGIVLLIGLERGWKTREATGGSRAAGIRTFALAALLGGVVASLANATGAALSTGLVLGFGFAVFAAVIAVFERDANRASDTYSATTIIAAMLTFLLGAHAVLATSAWRRRWPSQRLASSPREDIHAWIRRETSVRSPVPCWHAGRSRTVRRN